MASPTNAQLQNGRIAQVIGPVVDVEFPPGALPPINTALTITNPAINDRPDNLVRTPRAASPWIRPTAWFAVRR